MCILLGIYWWKNTNLLIYNGCQGWSQSFYKISCILKNCEKWLKPLITSAALKYSPTGPQSEASYFWNQHKYTNKMVCHFLGQEFILRYLSPVHYSPWLSAFISYFINPNSTVLVYILILPCGVISDPTHIIDSRFFTFWLISFK